MAGNNAVAVHVPLSGNGGGSSGGLCRVPSFHPTFQFSLFCLTRDCPLTVLLAMISSGLRRFGASISAASSTAIVQNTVISSGPRRFGASISAASSTATVQNTVISWTNRRFGAPLMLAELFLCPRRTRHNASHLRLDVPPTVSLTQFAER
jgi:hypothetical protein